MRLDVGTVARYDTQSEGGVACTDDGVVHYWPQHTTFALEEMSDFPEGRQYAVDAAVGGSYGALFWCAVVMGQSGFASDVSTGEVWCWGEGSSGQLGEGSKTDRTTPVQVMGLEGNATDVDCGYDHACAVVNASVWC